VVQHRRRVLDRRQLQHVEAGLLTDVPGDRERGVHGDRLVAGAGSAAGR